MENQKLEEFIKKNFAGAEIQMGKQYLEVTVDLKEIHSVAKFLKESVDTKFDYLFCESCVDFSTHFMMIYHLDSTTFRHRLVLKTKLSDRENPVVDSVYDIWKTSEYHEREIFDLFGVVFTNHPDLRKIFLDPDWVGFPLRKDYKDEVNIVER